MAERTREQKWADRLYALLGDIEETQATPSKLENLVRYAWHEARDVAIDAASPGPEAVASHREGTGAGPGE